MLAGEDIEGLLKRHATVLSADGEKIGSLRQAYVDDVNAQPSWVTVKTGLFGPSESFVPLAGARTDGNDLVVPYSKDQVKGAPRIDAEGHLEPAEEERLYAHYQLTGAPRTYTEAVAGGYDDAGGTVGGDVPGPAADDAVARSAERLDTDTGRQDRRRGRLRKYLAAGRAAVSGEGTRKRVEGDGADETRQ